ncbi:MAG: hypothetical protein C5B51_30340 [Terriglobia bacterium]|nr:MAG: hypothetical protein C5B51_30340 [Terriglobia bacterium]
MAAALAFSWLALTVHFNYAGNWTGLFCTGDRFAAPPPALSAEHIYLFRNSFGYDGQMYHYMAHDPFLKRGFLSSLDAPRFRYRRILLPLAAWLLATGRDQFVDAAYYALVCLSVFMGTLWVGAVAVKQGRAAAWALGFLAVPGVAVSLDRMTVDLALAALTAGLVHYLKRQNWGAVFVICLLASLVRESGLLLAAGVAGWLVLQRRLAGAVLIALSAAPAFAWFAYIDQRTPVNPAELLSVVPFAGLASRIAAPVQYPFGIAMNTLATVLDYAALAGIAVAVIYCLRHFRRLVQLPEGMVAFAFVALVAFVATPAAWQEAYAFARGYSPLILIVGLDGMSATPFEAAAPLVLTAPRIALQLGGQVLGIVRGLAGF